MTRTQLSIAGLNDDALTRAVRLLARRDPDLRGVVKKFGPPPMWARESGFSTLLHIILEQQVSLASARAAHTKLLEIASPLTPALFLELDDATLKAVGFSRQKALYGRELARSIVEGLLDLDALSLMDDAAVRSELIKIKGIGRWTADIYLLMVLRRPDIWPAGDLALAVAAQKVKRLVSRPTQEDLDLMSNAWKPWRAVAARILWHYYLSEIS
ncbi:MAG TPA: DNA-3-methyladenine glycosylase 2 family protein [Blastocatellia bacterium]|nr:DNA-3-methyladenine glycosylase 2 family protein [Blastocatellia bacterium]